MIRSLKLLVLVLSLVPLAACSGSAPPDGKCTTAGDCPTGQACMQGECKVSTPPKECKDGDTRDCYGGSKETMGVGACSPGKEKCESEKWSGKCEGEVRPTTEACSGKDDDCDGKIDNLPDIGKPCKDDQLKGPCADGIKACEGAKMVCKTAVSPVEETCNGKDDDCDGNLDNVKDSTDPLVRDCYSGPKDSEGKGECKKGAEECTAGKWSGTCKGEVLPGKEICNGKDDDCDGRVDNKPGEGTPLVQECYSGKQGTKGVGECKPGQQVCNSGSWDPTCTGEALPGTETCNGKDDDCDGKTDNVAGSADPLTQECYTGATGTKGVGECKAGKQSCVGGTWQVDSGGKPVCTGQVVPGIETCRCVPGRSSLASRPATARMTTATARPTSMSPANP